MLAIDSRHRIVRSVIPIRIKNDNNFAGCRSGFSRDVF